MSEEPTLVLVTGAGRSGTSTIAGALDRLGFVVPQPVLESNASNPRGFYESTWPVRFHRRLIDRALMEQVDGRPEAVDLIEAVVTPAVREELRGWLAGEFTGTSRVVVKDPRSAWLPRLWSETGTSLGVSTRYLTMVRHPAEIVASRSTYYKGYRPSTDPWDFAVMSLCGWVNANLVVERKTRGDRRVWVRYADLLADWRTSLTRVRDELGLRFDADPAAGPHPIDDFIDGGLRRHEADWGDQGLPAELCAVAEDVWAAATLLATGAGAEAEGLFDTASQRYAELYRASTAISCDHTTARVRAAEKRAATLSAPAAPAATTRSRALAQRLRSRVRGAAARGRGAVS